MTHIARYPTKKAFKDAIEKDPTKVVISDPAVVNPVSGRVSVVLATLEARNDTLVVTNHPQRSWYATVKIGYNGKIIVE